MGNDQAAYARTVLSLWAALAIAGWLYASSYGVPVGLAAAFVCAMAVEIALYIAPGFAGARAVFDSIAPPAVRALALTASAVAPYLVYSLGTRTFHWSWFGVLALLATVASAWFVVQGRRSAAVDILFLLFMAAVFLYKPFPRFYVKLHPKVPADILGQMMWIRVGVLAVLSIRQLGGIRYGFLPSRQEWKIGLQQFAMFIPIGVVLGMWLRFTEPRTPAGPWWRTIGLAVGTFLGILWVVALSEEFFFRGVLQQAAARLTRSKWAGLAIASCAFGAAHLWFRRFPDWEFAVLAAVAGVFYGIAYLRAGGIRAAMVTHALVVTTWRVFFR